MWFERDDQRHATCSDSPLQRSVSTERDYSRLSTIDEVGNEFAIICSGHTVSIQGGNQLWELMSNPWVAGVVLNQDKRPCYSTCRRRLQKKLDVQVLLDVKFIKLATDEVCIDRRLEKYPRRKYGKLNEYKRIWQIWRARLLDIVNLHRRIHRDVHNANFKHVILSDDAVPESRSGGVSFTVISLKFRNCRLVYPLIIGRPNHGEKVPLSEYYGSLLPQIKECGLIVESVVADAPRRCQLRRIGQFNSKQGKTISHKCKKFI